jgi:hypothetical protein
VKRRLLASSFPLEAELKEDYLGAKTCFAFLFLLVCAAPVAVTQEAPSNNTVHWCSTIPTFPVLQEAVFSAVYVFDLSPNGKPANIRRASVPFISKKDGPLVACIASWRVRSRAGKGTATFQFRWGWIGVDIASGLYHTSIPANAPPPKPH